MKSLDPAPAPKPAIEVCFHEALGEVRRAWRVPGFPLLAAAAPVVFVALAADSMVAGSGWTIRAVMVSMMFTVVTLALVVTALTAAADRGGRMLALKRSSPLPDSIYLAAKTVAAMVTTTLVIAPAIILCLGLGPNLDAGRWFEIIVVALTATAMFSLVGVGIGLTAGAHGGHAAATLALLVLALAILGGRLPEPTRPTLVVPLAWLSPWFQIRQLAVAIIEPVNTGLPTAHLAAIGVMSVAAALFARLSLRRATA